MSALRASPVERLELSFGELTPAERMIAEHLEAIAGEIRTEVESIPVAAADEPGAVASATPPAGESPVEAGHDDRADAGKVVRSVLLDVAALAVVDHLDVTLGTPARRNGMLAELRGLLHRVDDPGPVDWNPTGRLYEIFADSAEILPLEARVQRRARAIVDRALFGAAPLPSWESNWTPVTATMRRRFVAFLVDQGPVHSLSIATTFYASYFGWIEGRWQVLAVAYGIGLLGGLVNALLLSRSGTTLGKCALGLRVLGRENGVRLPLRQALLRETAGRVANAFPFGIGYLAGIAEPLHRTWGDRLVGTVVVRDPQPPRMRLVAGVVGGGLLVIASTSNWMSRWYQFQQRSEIPVEVRIQHLSEANARVRLLATRPVADDSELVSDMHGILEETPRIHALVRDLRRNLAHPGPLTSLLLPPSTRSASDHLYALMDRRADCAEQWARHAIRRKNGPAGEREKQGRIAAYYESDFFALTADIAALSADTTGSAR